MDKMIEFVALAIYLASIPSVALAGYGRQGLSELGFRSLSDVDGGWGTFGLGQSGGGHGMKGLGFGKGGLMGLGGLGISAECTSALGTTCPTCPTITNQTTLGYPSIVWPESSSCTDSCTTRWSSECRDCRQAMVETCETCQSTNAATLIAAGCQHITCKQTVQLVCPVCPTGLTVKDTNCRYCWSGNTTAACDTCRADAEQRRLDAEQCHTCHYTNLGQLVDGGCTQWTCKRTVNSVCPTCAEAQQNRDCRYCRTSNTTATCVSCRAALEECVTCKDANIDSLVSGGCDQLACLQAMKGLCTTCSMTNWGTGCQGCWSGNTTDTCTTCRSNRLACTTCLQENLASLPEDCQLRVPSAGLISSSVKAAGRLLGAVSGLFKWSSK